MLYPLLMGVFYHPTKNPILAWNDVLSVGDFKYRTDFDPERNPTCI
jgi:hypothetical protein